MGVNIETDQLQLDKIQATQVFYYHLQAIAALWVAVVVYVTINYFKEKKW